jgi:uncharacterized protein YndB with AHSA1/START domain
MNWIVTCGQWSEEMESKKTMADDANGTVTQVGSGLYELRFERRYALPIEMVWAALTDPARLNEWLAKAKVDLRVGGLIELTWPTLGDGLRERIVALDPPRLFAFDWSEPDGAPGSVVRWELYEEPEGCRLLMTHTLLRTEHLLDVASGWHNILDGLPDAAARPTPLPWSADRERAARSRQLTQLVDRYRPLLPREAAQVALPGESPAPTR